ncbi:MAG: prolipoprotein diacylglyceryl transferase [Desulfobacteraceae bacterium]|nr:prolipoprotein diacylglyceryl transferase [Desulfobacteraceae bacterium]MCF8094754.1 prolipoprotein diacylglyceryl transferase [Desulfobacteraceae bacterium]
MFPVIFEFGKFTLYTYGFFIALGVLAAVFFARHEAKRLGLDPNRITDLCFYLVIAAILGSRLFFVLLNYEYYMEAPLEVFKIWSGGLVFYGGFIVAFAVALVLVRVYGLALGKTADIAALAIPLGHFFGRLGCFSAGCCYGKTCELPWAVTFSHPESLAPLNVPVHPTQLYSAAANLFIFLVLLALRKKKRFHGQVFLLYLLLYGVLRSFIEIFRGDDRGGFVMHVFSVSQALGLSVAFFSFVVLVFLAKKTPRG